jgi:hypothetical protein
MTAARALGSLDYQGFAALSPSQIATPLGQLAIDAGAAELARYKPEARFAGKAGGIAMAPMMRGMPMGTMPMGTMPMGGVPPGSTPGSMPMAGMPGSMPPGGMVPGVRPGFGAAGTQKEKEEGDEERVLCFRRGLKQLLNAVRLGLNGPADTLAGAIRAVAQEKTPDRYFVDEVWSNVLEQIKILDKQEAGLDSLEKEIVKSRAALREILKGGPAAAAERGSRVPPKGASAGPAKK